MPLHTLHTLLVVAACSWRCLCLVVHDVAREARGPRPNILLILADDLGSNDVGWVNRGHGNDISTPHLDRLASEGVKMTNFYVQHVCGPSRAALLTGRYPMHLGLQHVNLFPDQENGVPRNESTIASALQSHGYATYAVGKWHLGGWNRELIPTRRGFDHFYGFLQGSEDHFKHTSRCGGKLGLDLWSDEVPDTSQRGVYSTHLFTQKARHFIRMHAKERPEVPFFMYLAYSAVHVPLQAPKDKLARFKHVENRKRRVYAAMLFTLDEGVGNVTEELQKVGFGDTVIIFFSDNGGQVTEGASNWPLRGWKGSLWEGGVRSQAFVRSPLLPAGLGGTSWNGLVHITDIMPTILGLAQAPAAGASDGYDFWPSLTGWSPESPRKEILLNIDPVGACTSETEGAVCDSKWGARNAALRVGDWKLVQRYPGDWPSHQDRWVPPPNHTPPGLSQMLMASTDAGCGACNFTKDSTENAIFDDSQVCLFNISKDPSERCDVAAANPEVVSQLMARLREYNTSAVPVRYPEHQPQRCNPEQFHNVIQWWAEADGQRAAPVLSKPYHLEASTPARGPGKKSDKS